MVQRPSGLVLRFIAVIIILEGSVAFTTHPLRLSSRRYLLTQRAAFDTVVRAEGAVEEVPAATVVDEGVTLTQYMQLPVSQYALIQMPGDAVLRPAAPSEGCAFELTIPPLR